MNDGQDFGIVGAYVFCGVAPSADVLELEIKDHWREIGCTCEPDLDLGTWPDRDFKQATISHDYDCGIFDSL